MVVDTDSTHGVILYQFLYLDNSSIKGIITEAGNASTETDLKKLAIRHELIHAFIFESGLWTAFDWVCEEMVDWTAHQLNKMYVATNNITTQMGKEK